MSNHSSPSITLIVPCFNEELNVPLFVDTVQRQLGAYQWNILFVNDGSKDNTWQMITQQAQSDKRVKGICFSRNFGHQSALKAGFDFCSQHIESDVYITLDADLQHPIELIPQMITLWAQGAKIVQTLRQDQQRKISLIKNITSRLYYKVFSWMSNTNLQAGTADFRLMDRSVLRFIVEHGDKELFLRGLLPWSGLKTANLPYTPHERIHGTSQYTLRKMLKLASSGILGYSTRPLYLSLGLGLAAIFLSACYFIYVMWITMTGGDVSVGWPSLMASLLGIGGVQLFVLGIIGIYLGSLINNLNKRPSYVIAEETSNTASQG